MDENELWLLRIGVYSQDGIYRHSFALEHRKKCLCRRYCAGWRLVSSRDLNANYQTG